MSETKHPERRAVEVGQRRRNHKEIFTIYAIEGSHAIVCRAGQTDPVTDYIHKGDESCCWESISVLADCEIVVDIPAVAPLAVDMPNVSLPPWTITALDPGSQKMADQFQKYIDDLYRYSMPSYFIPAKDRLPYLAAKPAERKLCEYPIGSDEAPCNLDKGHLGRHSLNRVSVASRPAPQPAPAKLGFSFTDKEDRIHRFATANERDSASRAYWSWMAEQTGKPYAGPERLARPKLTHQGGMHDDDLIGGER